MKVVLLKPLLLAIFIIIIFFPYVFFCIVLFFVFFSGGGGAKKTFSSQKISSDNNSGFPCDWIILFLLSFSFSIFPSFLRCNTEVALRLLKLPFNPQFKYMTLMYQQHM